MKMIYRVDVEDVLNRARESAEQIPKRIEHAQWLVYETISVPPFLFPKMAITLPLVDRIDTLVWVVSDNLEACYAPEWNEKNGTMLVILIPTEACADTEMELDLNDLDILLKSGWVTDEEYWRHGL